MGNFPVSTPSTAPSGAAGGQLSGTYPNPGLATPTLAVPGSMTVGGAALGGNAISANGSIQSSGNMNCAFGSVDVQTAGGGVKVAEGANAKQGVSTLVAGTVTVANTSVTASSRIFLTPQSLGTVSVASGYAVTARTPGTSFVITASIATDTSVIAWEMFEPG